MDDLREIFNAIQNKLNDLFNRVNQLEATPVVLSGGGGGAPVNAQYLTLALNAGLTNERRLDFSANFTTVDGGANADFDVDLSNTTVGAGAYGSATQVGTFTVDAKGRLTAAANVAITGVPPSAHNILSASHGDTLADNVVDGDIIIGNVTPKWARLAISIPAANVRNVLGIDSGELRPSWKAALDATNPSAITVGAAANPGTSLVFSHRDHTHATPATWTATAHNILDATYHSDTVTQAVTRGSLIYANATPKWDELTLGGITGSVLTRNATDVLWSTGALSFAGAFTLTIPATGTTALGTGTNTYVTYWNGTNTVTGDAGFTYIVATNSLNAGDYYVTDGGQFGISGNELLTVDAAGTFAFSGISGITVEDGDWIGNGSASARLIFDSSGATDYAYFSSCKVGIGTATPQELLHVYAATGAAFIEVETGDGSNANLKLTNTEGSFRIYTDADSLRVLDVTDVAVRMIIDGNGNLILGTTALPGGTATKTLTFGDNAGDPTPAANTAGLFAKNVGGTVEMFAIDEAANAVQLTSHPTGNLPFYALPWEYILNSSNTYIGKQRYIRIEKAIRKLEELTGEQFIFDVAIPKTDWYMNQAKHNSHKPKPQWMQEFN